MDSTANYKESLKLDEKINDKSGAYACAFNLGNAYISIPALRDLMQAESWLRRSLEMFDEHDCLGRAKCLGQLGLVAYEHFKEAREANKPKAELLRHINSALQFYHQALELLPANAVDDLAVTHKFLGIIYGSIDDIDKALTHFRQTIRYREIQGDLHDAGITRYNVSITLCKVERFEDARDYANAALSDFDKYGDRAEEEIQETKELIAKIGEAMKKQKGNKKP